jgi:hypothetical protein
LDFSRLNRARTVFGAVASALLVISVLFLPWFSLSGGPERTEHGSSAYICGNGDLSCTGFETFPILRWLLLLAALAPPILAWILVRGHKLSWPPGELTMLAGFAAAALIAYNGIIDRPGDTFGVSLDYGYWLALLASIGIAATGFSRSLESGARKPRKAPGTV